MAGQDVFDLAEFDALAAEFDLPVGAAEVFQLAVRAPAGQVAAGIHPGAGLAVGVGQEPFSGEAGPVQVAVRDAGAGDEQLARDPDGTGRNWSLRT